VVQSLPQVVCTYSAAHVIPCSYGAHSYAMMSVDTFTIFPEMHFNIILAFLVDFDFEVFVSKFIMPLKQGDILLNELSLLFIIICGLLQDAISN
jgi:hypothetical protein